jgi:heptosyltransferase-2
MQGSGSRILVYLPSPMGDAILCTPALRAIRRHFQDSEITFLASRIVREILSPCPFNDQWFDAPAGRHPFAVARRMRRREFTHAVLFKNSLGSALTTFLARVPRRIGYSRDARGFLLTDRLEAARCPTGGYAPVSMVDYYLAIASRLGADASERRLELHFHPHDLETVQARLPEVFVANGPVIILVPGGAFGPSKCWPSERFAQTADRLIEQHGATVVISVASNPFEKRIAGEISARSKHALVNLADRPVSLGELKALFSRADLVIANDTGPRHIAIALGRKVIALFGPNDPAWTSTGYPQEIQIVGQAPCAPCRKPRCRMKGHICMESISVTQVCDAATALLRDQR